MGESSESGERRPALCESSDSSGEEYLDKRLHYERFDSARTGSPRPRSTCHRHRTVARRNSIRTAASMARKSAPGTPIPKTFQAFGDTGLVGTSAGQVTL